MDSNHTAMTAEDAKNQSKSVRLTKGNRFKEYVEVIEYWIDTCSKMGDTHAHYFRPPDDIEKVVFTHFRNQGFVDLAQERNYLDQLQLIYPHEDGIRNPDAVAIQKIKNYYELKD